MVKKLIISVFLLVSVTISFAQSKPDTIIGNGLTDCEAIAYNSTNLIIYFYAIQEFDSIQVVLNEWQASCGISEPIIRTRILLAIIENNFSEDIYDSLMVDFVLNYLKRIETPFPDELYNNYSYYFGYVPIRGEFDFFTQSLADTLLYLSFNNPMELFYSELYANVLAEPLKEFQHDTIYSKTGLSIYYYQRVDKYRYKPDFNLNFSAGIWVPFENASLLGNHPVVGMQGGIRSQKMTYNFSMAFRFLESKNDYAILKDGYVDTTNYFLGGYIGADIERSVFRIRKNEFSLLAGVGFDGFESLYTNTEDDNPDNDKGHPINSVNVNFGMGFRHYFPNKTYLALQGKYNFMNYGNQGGTNLAGNSLTVNLLYGRFSNKDKEYNLNELRYAE